MKPLLGVVVAAAVLLTSTACGIGTSAPMPAGSPAIMGNTDVPESADRETRIYLTTSRGPWPVWRHLTPGADVQTSMDLLLDGPTEAERDRGVTTAVPQGFARIVATVSADRVDIEVPTRLADTDVRIADQIVCTAASAPGIPGDATPGEVLVVLHEPGDRKGVRTQCDANGDLQIAPSSTDESAGAAG